MNRVAGGAPVAGLVAGLAGGLAAALGMVATALLLWAGMPSGPAHSSPSNWPEPVQTCARCHGDAHSLAVMEGPHGVLTDSRTGALEQGCAACHGESLDHARLPAPAGGAHAEIVFDGPAASPPEIQDRTCLNCHSGHGVLHWAGSAHQFGEVTCAGCHTLHTGHDPVLDRNAEAETCSRCHRAEHAEFQRPFSHPVRFGQMACSDCHNPHGSPTPGELTGATLNETCHGCHAETRGPFLWEHPPAREDCMHCHQPHGSVHRDLLTQRTPFLCQQCHMAQFHPSVALSGTGLPGDARPSGSASLLGRDCMNCHTNVHGSNHPSGPGQTR